MPYEKRELIRSFPPDFVSAETLAYRLDCSRSTIDEYVRLGILPKGDVVGNLVRWDFEEVAPGSKPTIAKPMRRPFSLTLTLMVSTVPRPRKARAALPPHVHAVKAKGREYFYFQPNRGARIKGPRTPIPGLPFNIDGSPNADWWAAYRALSGAPKDGPRPGSFEALIAAYKASPEWRVNVGERTKVEWSRDLVRIEKAWGKLAVAGLEPKHVLKLRDRHSKTPAAANNLIKCLSAMLTWSIPRGWRTTNPCAHIKKLKIGEGYAPWDWEDIEFFRTRAPPHLWQAAALALYSGQRLGDVLEMRWSEVKDNLISVKQNKTGKRLWIPMHRDLQDVVAELPRTSLTLLANTRSKPWTDSGFKSSWSKAMNKPEMATLREKALVFHGLRKSAVVFLLEAGCTDAEVAAITGQSRQMVEHYARQVNQKKLAAAAVLKWERAPFRD